MTMANDGIGLAERGVPGHGVELLAPDATLGVRYRIERPSG